MNEKFYFSQQKGHLKSNAAMFKCVKVTTLQREPVNTVCENLSDSQLLIVTW